MRLFCVIFKHYAFLDRSDDIFCHHFRLNGTKVYWILLLTLGPFSLLYPPEWKTEDVDECPPADTMSKKKWSLRILSLALLQMHNPRTYPIDDDVAALRFPPCLLSDEVNLRNMPSRGKKWLLLDTRNLLTFNLLTLICHEMGLFSLRNYVTTRIPQYTRGKQWIEAIPHRLKITESDTFELLIFGIFHQFLSY